MTIDQAHELTDLLRSRYGMLNWLWTDTIAREYFLVYMAYGYEEALAETRAILRENNEPPTDATLDARLEAMQHRGQIEAGTYEPPEKVDHSLKSQTNLTNGAIAFEAAFRAERASRGVEVPEEWERRFLRWKKARATNAQIGAELVGVLSGKGMRGAAAAGEARPSSVAADLEHVRRKMEGGE